MCPAATSAKSCRASAKGCSSISTGRGGMARRGRRGSSSSGARASTVAPSPRRFAHERVPMHLLAGQPGRIGDGGTAVDLGQTPGDIVVLTAADSEIACLAAAQQRLVAAARDTPSLRLASLLRLGHNYSVDLYAESVVAQARLVV